MACKLKFDNQEGKIVRDIIENGRSLFDMVHGKEGIKKRIENDHSSWKEPFFGPMISIELPSDHGGCGGAIVELSDINKYVAVICTGWRTSNNPSRDYSESCEGCFYNQV